MSIIKITRGAATALLLLAVASPPLAFANDVDDANSAIAVAKSNIQNGDSLGATDQAADIQARARSALEKAQNEQKRRHQIRAIHAAENATALAKFAIASAELKTLTTQRDQLANR